MTTTGAGRTVEADDWGIQRHWLDADDRLRTVSADAVERLRAEVGRPPPGLMETAPLVVRPGRRLPGLEQAGECEVCCEDGSARLVSGRLPSDFPIGYHELRPATGPPRRLIVSPGVCWLPGDRRTWGLAVQVYAARSTLSWGIGDLADLATVRSAAESAGARFLLLSPMHGAAPTLPQRDSPYLPASRRFRNPLYLRVEDVRGADQVDLTDLAAGGRALNAAPLLDRDASWRLKREALWRLFQDPAADRDSADFLGWRRAASAVEDWAAWCALAEVHGPDWRCWPVALRRPSGPAVTDFVAAHRQSVDFHAWLQWLLDQQVERSCRDMTVVQDLPVGFDGGGADGWLWQDQTAHGVEIGAPPDQFNLDGQRWGAPPLIPWALRADGYEPFIQSVRATMAATGGLRVDHVMGLSRLWWVPGGCLPADGGYVRYPAADLLDIVALESQRARALVVGEDLGTVEPGVRQALRARGILSYRVMWFEDRPPKRWPVRAMAAVTTHDLPTIAGLWSGDDLAEQVHYRPQFGDQLTAGRELQLRRLRRSTGLGSADEAAGAPTVADAVHAAHRALREAPATMIVATLDDLLLAWRRPNLPGVAERPNWRIPLPVPVDQLGPADLALGARRLPGQPRQS